jgi:hypothetical protein
MLSGVYGQVLYACVLSVGLLVPLDQGQLISDSVHAKARVPLLCCTAVLSSSRY